MPRRFLCLPCLLVALVAPGCGSPQLNSDDFVAKDQTETRTALMVDQAERALNAGDVGMASARLQEIASSLSTSTQGQLVMARTLIAGSKFHEANELLAALAQEFPDEPEVDLVSGTLAEARGRWEAARVAYERALNKAPESIVATLLRARVDLVLGQPQNAAALLERTLAIVPGVRDLQEALAEAYLAAGDYALAADWYTAALDHDSSVAALRVRLAFAQSLSGEHLQALRTIREVRDPAVPPYVQLALARSALMIDEGAEAQHWLQLYVDAFPDDDSAWVDLARAHLLQGADAAALSALRSALRLDPSRADGLVLLGHLRLRAGQEQLALDTYLEALKLGADSVALAPLLESLIQKTGGGSPEGSQHGLAIQALRVVGGSGGAGG
jgi:tetratricopeptide (TPR) repeat protein